MSLSRFKGRVSCIWSVGIDVVLCSCGYLVHKALKAREALAQQGVSAGVVDLFRLKRVDGPALANVLPDMGPC